MENGEEQKLTEMERLKLENFGLRYNLLQQQMQQIVTERAALLSQIEANHPGFVWDEKQGLIMAGEETTG
jgi:Spy/CpxP family protein refolding chaperone